MRRQSSFIHHSSFLAHRLAVMSSQVESIPVLRGVLGRVLGSDEFRRLAAAVASGARVVSVAGMTSPAARALAVAALQRETGRTFAVVVQANRDMEAWARDLTFWCAALRGEIGRAS